MTSKSPMGNGARSIPACRPVDPPDGLNDRVIDHIDAMRSCRSTKTRAARVGTGMPVSRRAFVGVGALALAGAGVVGIALSRAAKDGRIGAPMVDDHAFGLQVAYADEDAGGCGQAFDLAPTAEGLVPVNFSRTSVKLLMNLTVRGEGVTLLVYRIAETPTLEDGTAASWFFEGRKTVLGPASASPDAASGESAGAGDGCVVYVPVPEEGSRVARRLDEFKVDAERHAAGNDGVSPRGYPYLLCTCVSQDALCGSGDEILALLVECQQALQAYSSWCDEHGETMSDYALLDEEGSELRSAYHQATWDAAAAIGEARSSSSEGFVSWMKSCYGIVMGLAADVFEQTTFVVEATFEDGSVAERAYRIVRTDGYDEAVCDWFDALSNTTDTRWSRGACSTVRANVWGSPSRGPRSGTSWPENPTRTPETSVWGARSSPSSTSLMSGRIAGRRVLPRMTTIAAQPKRRAARFPDGPPLV